VLRPQIRVPFARAKGLSATVILTLALGIGANAASSVVRGAPAALATATNRPSTSDGAPGIEAENARFPCRRSAISGPLKTVTALGEFSTITFTMVVSR
jgi:hypothetical protein